MQFDSLTPDVILRVVEQAIGRPFTPLLRPLASYINRVYELRDADGGELIVKFYRPGRWSREALADEHRFVLDCAEAQVPVVAPLPLTGGGTLGEHEGIGFALYPKRAGRRIDIGEQTDWRRLGSLVARMHLAGATRAAPSRVVLDPRRSTAADLDYLCTEVIPERFRDKYRAPAQRLIEMCGPWFDGLECIRIHGDCHPGNILDRLEEGLLLIDFDDMAMGPPIQDLWMLLPERADKARRELDLLLEGYGRFRSLDRGSLRCIEPLRAMRMVYFLAWQSRQSGDFLFQRTYPDWGSDSFWQREVNGLWEQVEVIGECVV